ncbi:MAG: DUF6268 family outer membrane beta-barrel protein [Bacteroidota bacterium]
MKQIFSALFVLFFGVANAQPFIDLANLRYTKSPDAGIIRRNNRPNQYDYFNITFGLPVIFKKDSSAIVFSPLAEQWNLTLDNESYLPQHLQSLALQTAYIKPLSQKWSMTFGIIPRWNGYGGKWFADNFQLGGFLLATFKKNQDLKYKFGVYYNSEFSGPFIIPLLGIDWKVNDKNRVFGVLPGNLVWEHKAGKNMYYGAVFRAITNSYQAGELNGRGYFVRIDDNQLALYSDIYLTKHIVFNMEAGHSIFRQVRMGYNNGSEKYFFKEKVNDDFIFKAALAYRIRL